MLTLQGEPTEPLIEKDQLLLECIIIITGGWPQPFLTWLLDGTPVFTSSRLEIDTDSGKGDDGLYYVSSTFTISSTIAGDSGMYTCRADLQIPNAPSLFGTASVTIQGQLAIGTTVMSIINVFCNSPARNDCILTGETPSTPCVSGYCIDDIDAYVCICNNGFTGINCTERGR